MKILLSIVIMCFLPQTVMADLSACMVGAAQNAYQLLGVANNISNFNSLNMTFTQGEDALVCNFFSPTLRPYLSLKSNEIVIKFFNGFASYNYQKNLVFTAGLSTEEQSQANQIIEDFFTALNVI